MMLQVNPATQAQAEPSLRHVPHNIEAEQALLGAILVNNGALDRVSAFLESGHFYDPLHAEIFEVTRKLIQAGKNATPITLRTFFETAEPIDQNLTVPQYLGRLVANATTIINAHDYGRTIYDLAVRRHLIVIGEDLVNGAYDASVDMAPAGLIEDAEGALYAISEMGRESRPVTMRDAVHRAVSTANEAYKRSGVVGLLTGLVDLDNMLAGLHPSDLIVLAGRPSMGKTALGTTIAKGVAIGGLPADTSPGSRRKGAPVLFFSLEMSAEQLAARILAETAEVPGHAIRRGTIDEAQITKYVRAADDVGSLPIHIDEAGGITIAQLSARARRMKRQHGIELIIIDYIQIMGGSARRKNDNRVQEITEITTGLKALAKELNVPIIALSQLSRGVETRENKRPQLSDLRESGSIEQDADIVMFVYREDYYVERQKPDELDHDKFSEWQKRMAACQGKAEVIIGKQRHGPIGTVELAFESQFTRFGNLARDYGQGGPR